MHRLPETDTLRPTIPAPASPRLTSHPPRNLDVILPALAHQPSAIEAYFEEQINTARLINTTPDIKVLKEALERDTGLLLANLAPGDRVLAVIHAGSPTRGDTTSIKFLNDHILGPTLTNTVIEKRQQLLSTALKSVGIDEEHVIENGYKVSRFRLRGTPTIRKAMEASASVRSTSDFPPAGDQPEISQAITQLIDLLLRGVERDLVDYISTLVTEKIDEITRTHPESPKVNILKKWQTEELPHFTLNFGISQPIVTEPDNADALDERLFADKRAEQWARIASGRVLNATVNKHNRLRGGVYSFSGVVNDIQRLRPATINDPRLSDFFEEVACPGYEGIRKRLKLSAIQNLRKWQKYLDSKPTAEEISCYQALKPYYDLINSIDYILRWASIEEAKHDIHQRKELLAHGHIEEIRAMLQKDPRNHDNVAAEQFHLACAELPEAMMISADYIGMGNLNVRDFEAAMIEIFENCTQDSTETKAAIQKASMKVGINVTTSLVEEFTYANECIKACLNPGTKLTSHRGGDELSWVIPLDCISDHTKLHQTLSEINARRKLRMAAVQKNSEEPWAAPDTAIKTHYEALQVGEDGITLLKQFAQWEIPGVSIVHRDHINLLLLPITRDGVTEYHLLNSAERVLATLEFYHCKPPVTIEQILEFI
ncbi:hypothetical protein KBB08_02355 [Candidatus Gracilibacteria bacterium]|nr:hypothetical protein [Candidatus Gracilibacteria bacterium]